MANFPLIKDCAKHENIQFVLPDYAIQDQEMDNLDQSFLLISNVPQKEELIIKLNGLCDRDRINLAKHYHEQKAHFAPFEFSEKVYLKCLGKAWGKALINSGGQWRYKPNTKPRFTSTIRGVHRYEATLQQA